MSRPKGICCSGELCKAKQHELCPGVNDCHVCHGTYRVLCCNWIRSPSKDDPYDGYYVCLKCLSNNDNNNNSTTKDTRSDDNNQSTVSLSNVNDTTIIIRCKRCGKIGHKTAGSSKCRYFKPQKKSKQTSSSTSSNVDTAAPPPSPPHTLSTKPIDDAAAVPPSHQLASNQPTLNHEPISTNISKPNYINVAPDNQKQQYKTVVDVHATDFKPIPTIFRLHKRNHCHQKIQVPPTPANLVDKYWSRDYVAKLVENSNRYR